MLVVCCGSHTSDRICNIEAVSSHDILKSVEYQGAGDGAVPAGLAETESHPNMEDMSACYIAAFKSLAATRARPSWP